MDEYYGWNRCWGILGISANQESRVVARGERAEQRPEEQSGQPGAEQQPGSCRTVANRVELINNKIIYY